MAYEDLTPEEQKQIDDFLGLLRPLAGEFARFHNHVAAAQAIYDADTNTIMSKLKANDNIPNKSGLAASAAVTVSEIKSLLSQFKVLKSTNDNATARETWAKFAGAGNLIG